ncbi:MAG: single-stranded DNA-binding protein [Aliifodinibius sp.]|nr:single-stranded DNA-binding protein [Fodinibius sp.]
MSKTNYVRLIGHLGQDPKLIDMQSGTKIASFSFATNERYTDSNGNKQENSQWHNIVAFGSVAQLCAGYLKKGSYCMLEGKLQTRQYQDKEGNNRYTTEVVVNDVLFLDKKPD